MKPNGPETLATRAQAVYVSGIVARWIASLSLEGVIVPAEQNRALAALSRWLGHGLVLLLASLAGCGTGPYVVPLSKSEKSLTFIALAYGEAHARLGRGPKNAEE